MSEITSNTLGETLALLIEGKKYPAARDVLETMHAADIAIAQGTVFPFMHAVQRKCLST